MEPVAVQLPLTKEYFWIELVLSSATYTVSRPATPPSGAGKRGPEGLPAVGKPGRLVIVWPLPTGRPAPTVPRRTALPELSDSYNCPATTFTWRTFVTVVESCVEVELP